MARYLTVSLVYLSVLAQAVLPQTPPAFPLDPAAPATSTESPDPAEENPEGYYAFMESPNATPPRVRPPPYRQVSAECGGAAGAGGAGGAGGEAARPHVSADNLCGDLNRGTIPRNPMGQNPNGEPYPFALFRNHTLRFLSRTLPVLRADDTVPRVTHVLNDIHHNRLEERNKRSVDMEAELPSHALPAEHRAGAGGAGGAVGAVGAAGAEAPRESRKFCDEGGVFCMLYRAFNGNSEPAPNVERREDPGHPHVPPQHRYEGPPTPCPARVEYATPVFARNYQGVWRYVVQIPYEGYFTQTVEVTRCMQSRCHYLEGGCLSSPRWVSLLVAELHYPAAPAPAPGPAAPAQEFVQYGAAAAAGAGVAGGEGPSSEKPPHCDGHDDLGCFQVRLYYDWFLVPGSCKCWRPDYFARYVRRRQNNEL